jgi:cell wall-associated NlpC family hydrolase
VQQFGLKSEHDLLDPLTNAKVAFALSKGGTDFGHWTGSREDSPKFKAMLGKFPGAGKASAQNAVAGAAAQAWQSGPAAIVAGPSPQDELAMRQQAAASLIKLGQDVVAGGDPSAAMKAFVAIGEARHGLAQAAMKANASNVGAAKYDGSTADPGPIVGAPNRQIASAIAIAKRQVGKPYVWGAEDPSIGFDCSGLIDYAFKQAGIKIPGRLTTQSALRLGQSVRGMPMRPGDWLITNNSKHMVMYVGNGQVIAAPHKGETVQYQPVSRFEGSIVDVRRLSK